MVLDGANCFDPFQVAELSRRLGHDPRDRLQRIFVSRAFTCHQMISLMQKARASLVRLSCSRVLLLGPLTTFYDENVPNHEAESTFQSFRAELLRLSTCGAALLMACQRPRQPTRRTFVNQLRREAWGVASCWEAGAYNKNIRIRLERPKAERQEWLLVL